MQDFRGNLRLIADVIGVDVALQLCDTIGTATTSRERRLYCTPERRVSIRLVEAVGTDMAERIRLLLPGQYVRVCSRETLAQRRQRRQRDAQIRRDYLRCSVVELVEQYRVSPGRICQVAQKTV